MANKPIDPTTTRIAEVLKSALNQRLLVDKGDTVAGHGSHVVSDVLALGDPDPTTDRLAGKWDEAKLNQFAEQLAKLMSDG